jgi:Putative Actinobacterial Holin-X, holin superfamily III
MVEEINEIKKELEEYIEIRLDIIRLSAAEQLSKVLSSTISIAIISFIAFFILLFISMAAGFMAGTLLHSNELGFLLVGLFYCLILVFFLIFKKQIIEKPVIRKIIRLLFSKPGDDETGK